MDLSFSPEEEAFRAEVQRFLREAMPPHLKAKADSDSYFEQSEVLEWHKVLFAKGWAAPHWPKEYGGTGWDAARRFIFDDEVQLSGAPLLSPFGLTMVGPLLIQFGTDAQKQRFLPKILSGEEVWCQGYSEPGAGSDLASLRMSAVLEGDHFVVNGQKTWTTYAQYADWIFCLVRTDSGAKKQAGISFLLIDIKTPGVEVKPMLTIGAQHSFCDTFFDNVRVPKENLVGPLHGGWTLAKALLGHERTFIAFVGTSRRTLRRIKRIAKAHALFDDPAFRMKIARLEVKLRSLEVTNHRSLASTKVGRAPGPESSILKIRGSEVLQQIYELGLELMGHDALSWLNKEGIIPPNEHWLPPVYCYNRATTIYGGTNEIQKNIIAKMILGLPGA
jgi:alkylation response protein AidB-like acyl-CoA dehydrogenase